MLSNNCAGVIDTPASPIFMDTAASEDQKTDSRISDCKTLVLDEK